MRFKFYKSVFFLTVFVALLKETAVEGCGMSPYISTCSDGAGNTYSVWNLPSGAICAGSVDAGASTWNPSQNLSAGQTPPDSGSIPSVAVSSDGKVLAGWLASWPTNQSNLALYVSIYDSGTKSWGDPIAISDPNDVIINSAYTISVNDNTTGGYNIEVTYQAYTNDNFKIRVTSGIFGDPNSWTTPVDMP